MLDGIDNNTSNVDFLSGVAYIVKPPVDAVDEITVLTSSFSAEYGRAGGAVLNTTLKSGTNTAARQRLGVPPQRRAQRDRLLRQSRQHQEGRLPVEPVRLHRRRSDHQQQDVLVRGLRRQPDQVGPHVGHQRAHRGAARQRLHGLLRPDLAAERHGRRRPPRPHVPARHDLRSGDDARGVAGAVIPDGPPATDGFVRDPFPGNRIPAGRLDANALRLMQPLSRAESARPAQQLRRQPQQHRRYALVRRPRRPQLQRQRPRVRALQLLEQHEAAAVAVRRRRRMAADSVKATKTCASMASRPATRTCSRPR